MSIGSRDTVEHMNNTLLNAVQQTQIVSLGITVPDSIYSNGGANVWGLTPGSSNERQWGKYDGSIGELRRKQIVINDIEHIGKESNNLEESEVIGVSDNDYVIYDNKTEQKITDVIKNMTTKDAKRIGLSKMHMFRLKKNIKEGKKMVLKKKTVNKLMAIK